MSDTPNHWPYVEAPEDKATHDPVPRWTVEWCPDCGSSPHEWEGHGSCGGNPRVRRIEWVPAADYDALLAECERLRALITRQDPS